jgi:hypothetical protein
VDNQRTDIWISQALLESPPSWPIFILARSMTFGVGVDLELQT